MLHEIGSLRLKNYFLLQMLGKKLMRKRATLQDIYRLYQIVNRVPKIVALLEDLECVTVNNVILNPMKDVLCVSCVTYGHLI